MKRSGKHMNTRITTWVIVAVAMVAQLIAGAVGRDTRLCVCSSGVTIESQGDACCAGETGFQKADPAVAAPYGCTDCHLIPLPDGSAAMLTAVPTAPPSADHAQTLPPVAIIVRLPAIDRPHRSDLERPPPNQHLRFLRSVVITC